MYLTVALWTALTGKSRKTHALILTVSCSCCPGTGHKPGADLEHNSLTVMQAVSVRWPADPGCARVEDPGGVRLQRCRLQASGDSTGGRAFSGTTDPGAESLRCSGLLSQIQEQIVEVIKVILQEQCQ